MNKKVTSPLTAAVIISLILIVVDIISGFANIKFTTWFRWIPTLLLCIAIIIICISYANQKDNLVTFGNVFGHGFKTSAIIACIMVVYTLLSIYLIFPDSKEKALEEARRQMEGNANLSEEQIDQALGFTRNLFLPIALLSAVFGTLVVGVIASLLGAAFAKKKPISPFDRQTA